METVRVRGIGVDNSEEPYSVFAALEDPVPPLPAGVTWSAGRGDDETLSGGGFALGDRLSGLVTLTNS